MPHKEDELLKCAKSLRREMTPAEARLWYHLRAKRFNGIKFVRQNPRQGFIVDFVARSEKLIIEVDGNTHGGDEAIAKDAQRTARLERQGYRVIRFSNAEVMGNIEAVLGAVSDALAARPLSPALSPQSGEREKKEV